MRNTSVLLLVLGQASALHLKPRASLRTEGRRAIVARATSLLLPFAMATEATAASLEIAGQEVMLDLKGQKGTLSVGGQEVFLDFTGQESSAEFREAKRRALEQEKKAAQRKFEEEEARGAKAAKELEAKAKKVNDKKPPTIAELLSNSVKQREAELGLSMTEEEVAELEKKLRKLYPNSS